MARSRSRLTAQGQISVPADIRRRLGLGPGSVLEWDEQDNQVVVRRVGQHSSVDIHRVLFGTRPPKARALNDLEDGIRRHIRKRHARD